MAKLHELLAAEKTPTGAWNQLFEETLKKFGSQSAYFEGHSKSLKMIEESDANAAVEAQARDEKPVTTTVFDTLDYALGVYAKAERLQFQKNMTNQKATGTVMFNGQPILEDLPVDQLLGLEARLTKIRQLIVAMPTLDATKHWQKADGQGAHIWQSRYAEETTKTEKTLVPVVLAEATKEHPAQIQPVNKDVVVGRFSIIRRSGAATAEQKANAIKRVDDLLMEVKRARMRANETTVVEGGDYAKVLVDLILEPLK